MFAHTLMLGQMFKSSYTNVLGSDKHEKMVTIIVNTCIVYTAAQCKCQKYTDLHVCIRFHIISAVTGGVCVQWGYSSVVEHLTADQEVPGSNPGAPFLLFFFFFFFFFFYLHMYILSFFTHAVAVQVTLFVKVCLQT